MNAPRLSPNIAIDSVNGHDWTFKTANTRELTHCFHDYPARMIPQVAGKILETFGTKAKTLFDPYCGTGTSLVEGYIRGVNVYGTDLNPLARLIATAKTTVMPLEKVDKAILELSRFIRKAKVQPIESLEDLRLDFWFKPDVIERLSVLKAFLGKIDPEVLPLFEVSFSETVRESSNTRNSEFKLYRYAAKQLGEFTPDVYGIMLKKLARNRAGLNEFLGTLNGTPPPRRKVFEFNTVDGIPRSAVKPNSIDIVVTSPPYGDSGTTVAYGQYSRLSSAWLGLPEPKKIDDRLMGGKRQKHLPEFPSDELNQAIAKVSTEHEKRGLEVAAFYDDLHRSIENVATIIKSGGITAYVVGNRKVKGIVLPTDIAVKDFFQNVGFTYIDTFHRGIPNKRMPLRNSPSNEPGQLDNTMTREYIVVLRKN